MRKIEPLTARNVQALRRLARFTREVAAGVLSGQVDPYDGAADVGSWSDPDLPRTPPGEIHSFIYAWSEWDERPDEEELWVRMTRAAAEQVLAFPIEPQPGKPGARVLLEGGFRCAPKTRDGTAAELDVRLAADRMYLQVRIGGRAVATVLLTTAQAWALADSVVNARAEPSLLRLDDGAGLVSTFSVRDERGIRLLSTRVGNVVSPEVILELDHRRGLSKFLQRMTLVPEH